MKYLNIFIVTVALVLATSCSEDDLDSKSIFSGSTTESNEFDVWLLENYVKTYNIDFKYRYDDKESNNTYNLIPADYNKAVALAKLTKHLYLESYEELMGSGDFIKTYCPKQMQLIGSPAYNSSGSMVLGTAEGGLKITLYNVNMINVDNIDIEQLNYWYFHTMHHEFAHILHQTKNYSTEFNTVSTNYQTTGWVNVDRNVAGWNMKDMHESHGMGFVTNYASNEAREDFVEIMSTYITHTQDEWNEIVEDGVQYVISYIDSNTGEYGEFKLHKTFTNEDLTNKLNDLEITPAEGSMQIVREDTSGRDKILKKFDIVYDYFLTSWGIDLDKLREIVLRRTSEVNTLNLKSIN